MRAANDKYSSIVIMCIQGSSSILQGGIRIQFNSKIAVDVREKSKNKFPLFSHALGGTIFSRAGLTLGGQETLLLGWASLHVRKKSALHYACSSPPPPPHPAFSDQPAGDGHGRSRSWNPSRRPEPRIQELKSNKFCILPAQEVPSVAQASNGIVALPRGHF
jgi:hypothetical protein